MTLLTLLLYFKIIGTFLGVGLPLIILSKSKIEILFKETASSLLVFRLYGVAIAALCMGYGFGIPIAQSGELPLAVVTMGLVSNAGAVLAIILTGSAKKLKWMAIYLSIIVAGLALSLWQPELMLARL